MVRRRTEVIVSGLTTSGISSKVLGARRATPSQGRFTNYAVRCLHSPLVHEFYPEDLTLVVNRRDNGCRRVSTRGVR